MGYLELTFPTPAENLACDEALLQRCEDGHGDEVLRFWEAGEYFVVLGHAGKSAAEVNLASCRRRRVPLLRRCSGGGTVLQGPGCLNYSLILKIGKHDHLKTITETNNSVMQRLKKALQPLVDGRVEICGHTDLVLGGLKFSGNSQYRKRRCLLFHGTFLLDFDIPLIDELLPIPLKQPAYRKNRPHSDFLANLHLPAREVKEALKRAWGAAEKLKELPSESIKRLVRERYGKEEWNFKL